MFTNFALAVGLYTPTDYTKIVIFPSSLLVFSINFAKFAWLMS